MNLGPDFGFLAIGVEIYDCNMTVRVVSRIKNPIPRGKAPALHPPKEELRQEWFW